MTRPALHEIVLLADCKLGKAGDAVKVSDVLRDVMIKCGLALSRGINMTIQEDNSSNAIVVPLASAK